MDLASLPDWSALRVGALLGIAFFNVWLALHMRERGPLWSSLALVGLAMAAPLRDQYGTFAAGPPAIALIIALGGLALASANFFGPRDGEGFRTGAPRTGTLPYFVMAWLFFIVGAAGDVPPRESFGPAAGLVSALVTAVFAAHGLALTLSFAGRLRRPEQADAVTARNEAELLADHLNQARVIQRSLMPLRVPLHPDYRISLRYLPVYSVGGDLFGFIEFPDGALGIYIADVSGHGIPAAIISLMTKQQFDSWAHIISSPAETLTLLNQNMLGRTGGQFVTLFYGILKDGVLHFANAGHNRPYLYRRAEGRLQELSDHGRLIGIYDDLRCQDYSVPVAPGDRLVLYTDGIAEVGGSLLTGEEHLRSIIEETVDLEEEDLMEAMLGRLRQRNGGRGFVDDVTLVVVDRLQR